MERQGALREVLQEAIQLGKAAEQLPELLREAALEPRRGIHWKTAAEF